MKPRHSFYKSLREKIGTRHEVSKLLGVHIRTLERRENGQIKINDEMVAALEWWIKAVKIVEDNTSLAPKLTTSGGYEIPKATFKKLSDPIQMNRNVVWALEK